MGLSVVDCILSERPMFKQSVACALLGLAVAVQSACGPSPVTFEVAVPPETPAGATIAIIGGDPALGGGNPPGFALSRQDDGTFKGVVSLPAGKKLSYFVAITTPDLRVEQDANDAAVSARPLTVGGKASTESVTVEGWGPLGGLTTPNLTVIARVPASTPAGAEIWISGNQTSLGSWNGKGVQLVPTVDGRYAASVPTAPNTRVEFKATRGAWSTVEKGASGEEITNRVTVMTPHSQRVEINILNWADLSTTPPGVLTGDVRYLRNFASQYLTSATRDIILWFPPDYATNTTRRYPVLYMHDGQNLMDASTSFAGEWHADETAQQLTQANEIDPPIIVGIYNANADRSLEYTWVADPNIPTRPGGKADNYGRFLVEELKPYIDSHYRTKPEASNTGLAGSSLGGLVTMYLGLKYPNVFQRLGVVSPSVIWANKGIVAQVNALSTKPALRIWEDIGTAEVTLSSTPAEDARALRDALLAKGWTLGTDFQYVEANGAAHNETAWSARFPDILKFLFPKVP